MIPKSTAASNTLRYQLCQFGNNRSTSSRKFMRQDYRVQLRAGSRECAVLLKNREAAQQAKSSPHKFKLRPKFLRVGCESIGVVVRVFDERGATIPFCLQQ